MRAAALFAFPLALGAMIAPASGVQAATKITACETISKPGSYELAANLASTSGNCLVITVSFVTVDLQGFSISGQPFSGTGISASAGVRGITVRSGSISGFQKGVDLPGADSVVEGLRVVNNRPFGEYGITANGIVKGNIVSGWEFGGISAGGIVTGNLASGNKVGILVSAGSTVIGNTDMGDLVGFTIDCPSNVVDNISTAPNNFFAGTGCKNTNNLLPP